MFRQSTAVAPGVAQSGEAWTIGRKGGLERSWVPGSSKVERVRFDAQLKPYIVSCSMRTVYQSPGGPTSLDTFLTLS